MVVRRNYREVDWKEFRSTLRAAMPELPQRLPDVSAFEEHLRLVYSAIEQASVDHVAYAKPSPHVKRWWSSELSMMRKQVANLAVQAFRKRWNRSGQKRIP